jgi:hypothetical protein
VVWAKLVALFLAALVEIFIREAKKPDTSVESEKLPGGWRARVAARARERMRKPDDPSQ